MREIRSYGSAGAPVSSIWSSPWATRMTADLRYSISPPKRVKWETKSYSNSIGSHRLRVFTNKQSQRVGRDSRTAPLSY